MDTERNAANQKRKFWRAWPVWLRWGLPALLCVLLGLLLWYWGGQRGIQGEGGAAWSEEEGWKALLAENDALQGELRELERQLYAQQAAVAVAVEAKARLEGEISALRRSAGLETMSGSGLRVRVEQLYVVDASGKRQVFQRVLDEDLLALVNELNASGAEGIAINGQRLTARSEIRSAGVFISINGQSCSAPFVLEALGDPVTLEAGLRLNGGVLDKLGSYYDITVKALMGSTELELPAYEGSLALRYAAPLTATPLP